jgi:hypothetical protein
MQTLPATLILLLRLVGSYKIAKDAIKEELQKKLAQKTNAKLSPARLA